MELKNFDNIISRVPKKDRPLRVVLAGSEGENMLKGIFRAQQDGFVQPILAGDRARTMTLLEKLGLDREPYTMAEVAPGGNATREAIRIINSGDADILMRGSSDTHQFLVDVLAEESQLRTDRIMTHVSLASLPEYPKLLALSDMTVVVKPTLGQKKAIIRNMADALKAFGYEHPKLAMLSLVEEVNFNIKDTIQIQQILSAHAEHPIADCELWGPISYDLILSKEAARLKNYDCPYSGGGFDGIIAPNLSTANTLVKSWLIHAHAVTCGAVVGAKVPIALTSRSAAEEETYLSLVFCAILDDWRKKQKKQ